MRTALSELRFPDIMSAAVLQRSIHLLTTKGIWTNVKVIYYRCQYTFLILSNVSSMYIFYLSPASRYPLVELRLLKNMYEKNTKKIIAEKLVIGENPYYEIPGALIHVSMCNRTKISPDGSFWASFRLRKGSTSSMSPHF